MTQSRTKYNPNIIANDKEWNKHRCKWQKRVTSKVMREGAKKFLRKGDF